MSIIQQEMNDIIENYNTGQSVLEDLVKDLNENITELTIQSSLQGDLDLSLLENRFKKLQTISFGKGKITHIRNVPRDITKFICSNNLLTNLEDLPDALLYLDIDHNFFDFFDFKHTPHLEEFHCSHNRLTRLENMPDTLTKLYCDYNDLNHLNLKHLPNLKILHCSHNPILMVENLPENIHEFVAENTLYNMQTSIDYDVDHDPSEDHENQKPSTKGGANTRKIHYQDALQSYFSLKQNYEKKLLESKRKIYQTTFSKTGSKKTSKRAASEEKGKCIHCKRKVGTRFYTNHMGYYAVCGDVQNPCALDIKLFRGNFYNIEHYMHIFREQTEEDKEDIIKHKLDTLFGHISEDESVKLFKPKFKDLSLNNRIYDESVQRYNDLFNNPQKKDDIRKKQQQIHEINDEIQTIMNEYHKDTTNTSILQSAIHIYIQDLLPEMENLRRLKYDTIEMIEDVLSQREVNLSKIEYIYGEPPKVEKFVGV